MFWWTSNKVVLGETGQISEFSFHDEQPFSVFGVDSIFEMISLFSDSFWVFLPEMFFFRFRWFCFFLVGVKNDEILKSECFNFRMQLMLMLSLLSLLLLLLLLLLLSLLSLLLLQLVLFILNPGRNTHLDF